MHSLDVVDCGLKQPVMWPTLHDDSGQAEVPDIGILSGPVQVTVSDLINEQAASHEQKQTILD
jgi:hypothetical protein